MVTGAKIALWVGIAVPLVGGGGYLAKLVGDEQWVNHEVLPEKIMAATENEYVPVGAYQQEKLYDLQDEAFEFELKEKYEGDLSPREQEQLDRLLKRIERLEQQIEQ